MAGCPEVSEGWIDAPIGADANADTSIHQTVVPEGLPARTRWRVRARYSRHALLELEPLTGRTHQLRVHLAHIGVPIVADHLYGDPRPLLRSHAALRPAAMERCSGCSESPPPTSAANCVAASLSPDASLL